MPQFAPGEVKNAIAPIVAKPSGMSCEAELFLGPNDATKVVTSGRVSFVSTGAAKNVSLPITMPGAPGGYHGYIDVFAGDLRFLAYILKEDVVVAAPSFSFSNGLGRHVPCPAGGSYPVPHLEWTIQNNTSVAATRNITLMSIRRSDVTGVEVGPFGIKSFELTLQPGQSYSYSFDGFYYLAGEWYCEPVHYSKYVYRYWLEDGVGGKSSEIVFST